MRTAHRQTLNRTRQRGAALLVMLVLLITGGAYLLVSQLNRASGRIDAQKKTAAALAQAKEALIGWAVSNLTTPGMLPYPDRRNDGDYDGRSDCPAAGIPTSAGLLLGKIPQIGPEAPCLVPWTALNLDVVDGAGEVLWYAVSRNMVSALGVAPVINPDIMDTPPFPWLIVRDQTGAIINNRVAFVLIAPGPPLPGQNRSGAAPASIQFLEGIGAVTNADSNGSYDGGVPACPSGMCEDFVMSEPWPSATAPTFNDRLLYVTIDELMPLIEMRVAREVRQALRNFVSPFPPPASLGYTSYSCGTTDGFLPIPACECKTSGTDLSCDCPFDAPQTASITYSYTGLAPAVYVPGINNKCTATAKSCQCTGAGSCSGPTQSFQCSADGVCTAKNIVPAAFSVSYTLPASPPTTFMSVTKIPIAPAGCSSVPSSTMLCSNFTEAQGIVNGGCTRVLSGLSGLPLWFLNNRWKNFMYYAVRTGLVPLTVGAITPVDAMIISVGRPLVTGTPQTRPSSSRDHYLESAENIDGPATFTGVGQPLTNIFNDQAVIVSP